MDKKTITALSKGLKTAVVKDAVDSLSEGTHAVNAVVRVQGIVKRGADYQQVCHLSADPWGLLTIALSKLNSVTLDYIIKEAMKPENEKAIQELKKQAEEAIKTAKVANGTKTYRGKVTTDLTFEEVELLVQPVTEQVTAGAEVPAE